MYKICLCVLVVATVCTAVPNFQEQEDGQLQPAFEPTHRANRIARATCDLLSASAMGVTLNHSACTAHCLYIGNGYRGGRCINGICHCRK